jgi:hypothetical protein
MLAALSFSQPDRDPAEGRLFVVALAALPLLGRATQALIH